MAYVRWIEPHTVYACYDTPHYKVIAFMVGEWTDADTILSTAAGGFVRDEPRG